MDYGMGGDDAKDAQDESAEEKSNLWREFLKTAVQGTGRGLQATGHLIVFGAQNSGKSTLISQFGKLENKFVEMKRFLMMRYAYCHLTTPDSEDSFSLLNIWQIAEPAHAEVLDVVIPAEDMGSIAYLICLDLSKPNGVEAEFAKWMDTITKIQSKLLARCGAAQQQALKDKISKHLQFYVNPKSDVTDLEEQMADEEKEEQAVEADAPSTNLGAPVIVVANKCDAFRKHFEADADAEDHFEIICSYIRWWSIQFGAASFSMQKGLKDQARRILQYIDHRVFETKFDRGPNAVVKLANPTERFLFIPSGFDSADTIKAQNPNRDLEETPFNSFFKPRDAKKKFQALKPTKKSDDNDHFLKAVLFDLKSGDRGGASRGQRSDNEKVDINDFFQRLLDPSQAGSTKT